MSQSKTGSQKRSNYYIKMLLIVLLMIPSVNGLANTSKFNLSTFLFSDKPKQTLTVAPQKNIEVNKFEKQVNHKQKYNSSYACTPYPKCKYTSR